LEYLLDDNGEVLEFRNEDAAKTFLKTQGFTDEYIYWLVFKEADKP
jgi:hypothetical protein